MNMLLNKSNSEQVRYIFKKNSESFCLAMNLHTTILYVVKLIDDKITLFSNEDDKTVIDEEFNKDYIIRELEY